MISDQEDDESYVSSTSTHTSFFSVDSYGDEMFDYFDGSNDSLMMRIENNDFRLTQLSVYNSGKDWARLGRAVGQNYQIEVFRVFAGDDGEGIVRSTEVVDAFCAGLAQNRSITVFHSEGLEFTSGQIQIMRPFFSQNARLTEIKLKCSELECGDIRFLTEAIKERGKHAMTIRSFSYSDVASPSHISAILDLAKACTHLKSLRLSCLRSSSDISSCEAVASFLASKKCTIRKLNLIGNTINDAGCRIIAESLRNNSRLRQLCIDESWLIENHKITGQGFASFIPVVCDTSSIESTLISNHTLVYVNTNSDQRVPRELYDILQMNRSVEKSTVAKLKVLRYHFSGNFNMSAIAGLDAKALPDLLAWFNRLGHRMKYHQDGLQLYKSAFHRIIRHNPELCSYPSPDKLIRLKLESQVATLNCDLRDAREQVATLNCELRDARKQIEALKREAEELNSNKRLKIGAK